MSVRPRRAVRPETTDDRFERLVQYDGAVTSREGLPFCDSGSARSVKSMVVGGAYEYPHDHAHTRLVMDTVRLTHEEAKRDRSPAPTTVLNQTTADDGTVFRVTAHRRSAIDWAWIFVSVDKHGTESGVEIVHEPVVA